MQVLFMGTPEFAVSCLEALVENNLNVCGVVTQNEKPKGRGKKLSPSSIKLYAEKHNLKVYEPLSFKNNAFEPELKFLNPEVIVVVAYGKILPKYVLDFPKFGCINVHASLLPKYRGAAPIQWAIINGETETGVTTIKMNEGVDTGDIILKTKTDIGLYETYGELYLRLSVLGASLLIETLNKIASLDDISTKQDDENSSYAPMIYKKTARISWFDSAKNIVNLIRGTNPSPVSWTTYKGIVMKIHKAHILKNENYEKKQFAPGQIIATKDNLIHVWTPNGIVLIEEIQFPGKKIINIKNYLNGNKIDIGDVFI